MKIIHNESPFFYISIENIFSENIFSKLYDEINSLKSKFKTKEYTGSAVLPNGENLKNNKGLFLEELDNFDNLQVTKEINKLLYKILRDKNWKNFAFRRMFNSLLWGGGLINYYENNDYYKPHIDDGIFSLIIWMYDKKSSFEGGDLYFPEYDYLHQCKNNHGILFFSKELHGVIPISSCEKDLGRYSIVTFSATKEDNKKLINYTSINNNILYQ